MYSTTHLALGLIIGKVTGDYQAAVLGSLIIDIDHLIPNFQQKNKFILKDFWKKTKDSRDSSRSYFHSFFAWIIFSIIVCLIDYKFGLVFSLAYLGHFLLDALDDSSFYPIFPIKKFDIRGFIPYYSKEELFFSLILFFIFIVI